MKMTFTLEQVPNPLAVLRRAGYSPFTDPGTKKESFTLKPTAGFYPRFHLYLGNEQGKVIFDLHLDQKKPGYGSNHMHNGEYDSPTVQKELMRIAGWVNYEAKNREK
ncbi:MAG: hypothetical protein UU46_C0003G0026 [Candidatus Uhrbacteria bacterium GW2011_GWD1_41_16]|uniref:Uncharacterized protein n=1 Tax=Candidatus Uhrbacteria bacterium GW2011_GWC1_41_20 TaxID=1618983 RepID=A0A0G0VF00_9BACT|nr:MAG: hypothetical protein UT52_C0005G0015 [Candidatus Uhrbacteria bacterium GW2011_GWE1_39_46]KKR63637.1 MAG: hypothetical protein UU04_C0015G0026 [Candidatus Uhrbacteria bacterium GW2011_GWC2_40_450]KKR89406.1 MAG: hypothetical protein UU36_C0029G0002 [Candidatus Uhrbacteria bacterium GW2011_GWE2_41_1153]KKR96409.1 MAG: hypothetical protein UU46_C0003G0026 [Candidatus Uhrbacteria bacterium GW2011_GWD1_41_16]KKR99423.1 MAG: hypothetical protein UU50_C0006G0026 [Candidatus Uhrbacteria bacteri